MDLVLSGLIITGAEPSVDSESSLTELTEEETAKAAARFGNITFKSKVGKAFLAEGDVNFNSEIEIKFVDEQKND